MSFKRYFDFFAVCFHEGYEYCSIDCIRSAFWHIMSILKASWTKPSCMFFDLRSFNGRPLKPRYLFLWDVEEVLHFVKVKK